MQRELVIGDVFANAATAVPRRVAVALGNRTLTFAEVDAASDRLGRLLGEEGVARGTRVAVWCDTALEVVPLFAALAKVGALFIPLNAMVKRDEVATLLARAKPDLLVVDTRHSHGASPWGVAVAELGDLLERSSSYRDVPSETAPVGTDPHVAFFTSGSTGTAKGVVLSHRVNVLRTQAGTLLEPRGAMVCPYPLFHMGAWTIALQQWQARDTVVLLEQASAGAVCEAVERHHATRLNCIPAVWRRIIDHLGGVAPDRSPLATIRFADTGTSATPLDLLESIATCVPDAHLRVFYGSTEAGSVASLPHNDFRDKPGSCGVPGPGVAVRIADRELQVRSTMLFDGYLDDPLATAGAFADGWYRTGDCAVADDDGYLTIVGRLRDEIRTGGETVEPARVEAALLTHPGVREVAVVGIPDATWGEVVCAVVVAAVDASPPSLEDLRRHCRGVLAPFQEPRRLEVMGTIPRTSATGQVQRRLLVELLAGVP